MGRGRGGFSGFTCVKFLFFAFNVIFWLLGCAILGVGIWLHVSKGAYASLAPSFNFLSATALCIAAGTIVLIVGFLGCCGAIMESRCLLLTYFVTVSIIFVLEIVAGILAFVYQMEIERTVQKELLLGIQDKYNMPEQKGLTDTWDQIQAAWQCCGVESYEDWQGAEGLNGDMVPQSCCISPSMYNCGKTYQLDAWHETGCLEELKYRFKQNLYVVGVVAITIGVIQVLGMVASMALFCCLRSEKRYE